MYRRVSGHRAIFVFRHRLPERVESGGREPGLWEICIIWGLGISLAVYLTSGISGAGLNPAVTVALWLFACFPGRKAFPYIVSQVAGAFGGAVLAYAVQHYVYRV